MISGSNRTSTIYANGLNIRRVHSRRSKGVPRVVSRFVPGHGTLSGTLAGTLCKRAVLRSKKRFSERSRERCVCRKEPRNDPRNALGTPLERPWNAYCEHAYYA
jgi:hypothetical protein